MAQGLDRLVGYFQDRTRDWPFWWEKIPTFVRALALRYERAVSAEGQLAPQGLGIVVRGAILAKLVDFLLNTIFDYISVLSEPRFVCAIVEAPLFGVFGGWKVRIDKEDIKDLGTHWDLVRH